MRWNWPLEACARMPGWVSSAAACTPLPGTVALTVACCGLCGAPVAALPQGSEEKQERVIGRLKEGWVAELKRQKEGWAAADKQRREAWMEAKASEIKDLTVKGLEGEVRMRQQACMHACHTRPVCMHSLSSARTLFGAERWPRAFGRGDIRLGGGK